MVNNKYRSSSRSSDTDESNESLYDTSSEEDNSSSSGYDISNSEDESSSEEETRRLKSRRRVRPKYVINPNYEKEWYEYCHKYYQLHPPPIPSYKSNIPVKPPAKETDGNKKSSQSKEQSRQTTNDKECIQEKRIQLDNKANKSVNDQEYQKSKANLQKKSKKPKEKNQRKASVTVSSQSVKKSGPPTKDMSTFSRLSRAFKSFFTNEKEKFEIIDGIKLFPRQQISEFLTDIELDDATAQETLSILSWNVLAQRYIETKRGRKLYSDSPKKALNKAHRMANMTNILSSCPCDIFCLQEVDHGTFNYCLVPFFSTLGYNGLLHCSQLKNGTKLPGLATFYKTSIFTIGQVVESHRVLIVEFTFRDNKTIVVANCHLEANPTKETERFNQLKAGFKKITKLNADYVVVSGDFNSTLDKESKLTKLLDENNVTKSNIIFRQSTCQRAKIDHICIKQMKTVGVCKLNEPNTEIIPSLNWPSDHMLVISVLELLPKVEVEEVAVVDKNEDNDLLKNQLIEILTSSEMSMLEDMVAAEKSMKLELKKTGRKLTKEEIQDQREKSRLRKEFISTFENDTQTLIRKYIKKNKVKI